MATNIVSYHLNLFFIILDVDFVLSRPSGKLLSEFVLEGRKACPLATEFQTVLHGPLDSLLVKKNN